VARLRFREQYQQWKITVPRVQYYNRDLGNGLMALGGSLDIQLLYHERDTQGTQEKYSSTWSKGRVRIGNRRPTPRNSLSTIRETGIRNTTTRTIDIRNRKEGKETRNNKTLQCQTTLHSWRTTLTHNIDHKARAQFLVQDDKVLTQDDKI